MTHLELCIAVAENGAPIYIVATVEDCTGQWLCTERFDNKPQAQAHMDEEKKNVNHEEIWMASAPSRIKQCYQGMESIVNVLYTVDRPDLLDLALELQRKLKV